MFVCVARVALRPSLSCNYNHYNTLTRLPCTAHPFKPTLPLPRQTLHAAIPKFTTWPSSRFLLPETNYFKPYSYPQHTLHLCNIQTPLGRRKFAFRPNWNTPAPRSRNPVSNALATIDRYTQRYFGRSFDVVGLVIALNVGTCTTYPHSHSPEAVFVLWQTYGNTPHGRRFMRDNFQSSLRNTASGRVWTLLTSNFSHSELSMSLVIWL